MRSLLTLATLAAALAVAGCASGSDEPPTSTPAPATSPPSTPAPERQGVSPGGVTTSLTAPAESTEEQYFQACNAARVWMEQQGGDPRAQIEPYLAMVQSADAPGPGTFGSPWSELRPGQQAAVIVAVQAAADALCG